MVKARPLGEIESELLQAENDYVEADEALKKAKKAREQALEEIISRQLELDDAISKLRSVATPGSRWHAEQEGDGIVLDLDESTEVRDFDAEENSDAPQDAHIGLIENLSDAATTSRVSAQFAALHNSVEAGRGE